MNRDPSSDGGSASAPTVLIAEDDPSLLTMASHILRRAGYVVHPARDGEEAYEVARSCGRLSLLFTDVVMSERSGLELAAMLRADRPGLPVLVTSGDRTEAVRQAVEAARYLVLPKPYTSTQLREAALRARTQP